MRLLVALLYISSVAACAHSREPTTPAPTYPIEVRNTIAEDLIVAYDDGTGARLLGTVTAGATERFIIAAPRTFAIRIMGRTADGSRVLGPFAVILEAGVPQAVTLR